MLVNRVFDADADSGVAFIRQVKGDEKLGKTPVLLVSGYQDAQATRSPAGAGWQSSARRRCNAGDDPAAGGAYL